MNVTSISCTDLAWNPVTGCSKVSAGCKHCYAERVFPRAYSRGCMCGHQIKIHDHTFESNPCLAPRCFCAEFRSRIFTDVRCHPDRLEQPLRWRKPARIFVNSMSDLFHQDVSDEFLDKVFMAMGLARQHTFFVLTKRPERMLEYCASNDTRDRFVKETIKLLEGIPGMSLTVRETGDDLDGFRLNNVWLMVSAEDQKTADERIPLLLRTPAAGHGVSLEPILAPIDLRVVPMPDGDQLGSALFSHGTGAGIDWAIVGGESGPKARPCNVEWIRSVVEQCKVAKVPVWVKQMGSKPVRRCRNRACQEFPGQCKLFGSSHGHGIDGMLPIYLSGKGGDMQEWPEDLRIREFPKMRLL